jgi:hypothetical protein
MVVLRYERFLLLLTSFASGSVCVRRSMRPTMEPLVTIDKGLWPS